MRPHLEYESTRLLHRDRFQQLIDVLIDAEYRVVGPRPQSGRIVYTDIHEIDELPRGLRDKQQPGSYVLEPAAREHAQRYFGWANGAQALKPLLFVPREKLWRVEREPDGHIHVASIDPNPAPVAVLGVRACDLAALEVMDAHFLKGPGPDAHYGRRRDALLLIAVDCSHPASTCFCAATETGPTATSHFDIAMSEIDAGFLVRTGSLRGADIVGALSLPPASPAQRREAAMQAVQAKQRQVRALPPQAARQRLFDPDHPRWDEIAERCLGCGNCTSVCPTCYCHTEADAPALDGLSTEHYRDWDSCFARGVGHLDPFVFRSDRRSRFQQWITHKLGGRHDTMGRSGCVGCGRCIAWCPVGLSMREEVTALCSKP